MAAINRNNYELFFIDYYDGTLPAQQVAELKEFLRKNPDLNYEFESFQNIVIKPSEKIPVPDFSFLKKSIDELSFTDENADELIISLLENDYPTEKQEQLRRWIQQNPKAQNSFEKLQKAKLAAQTENLEKLVFYRMPDFENDPVDAGNAQWFAIAQMEGDLSEKATHKYQNWLKDHPEHRYDFSAVRLHPDTNIVYPKRDELKQKHSVKIRFFVFSTAIAASIMLTLLIYNFLRNQTPNPVNHSIPAIADRLEIINQSTNDHGQEKSIEELTVESKSNSPKIIPRGGGKIAKLSLKPFTPAIGSASEPFHAQALPLTLPLAIYHEPEQETPSLEIYHAQKPRFLMRTASRIADFAKENFGNKIPTDKFKFDYKLNDDRQIVYFAIETPVFAIERKK